MIILTFPLVKFTLTIILSGVFGYALFSDAVNEEDEPKKVTMKKKPVKVKKNGKWIDM